MFSCSSTMRNVSQVAAVPLACALEWANMEHSHPTHSQTCTDRTAPAASAWSSHPLEHSQVPANHHTNKKYKNNCLFFIYRVVGWFVTQQYFINIANN